MKCFLPHLPRIANTFRFLPCTPFSTFCSPSHAPPAAVQTVFEDEIKRRVSDLSTRNLLLEVKNSLHSAVNTGDVERILSQRASVLLQPDCCCLLRLMDMIRRGRRPELALQVFEWKRKQPDAVLDSREYSKMITLAGKLGQLKSADALYEEMKRRGVSRTIEVENALMLAHARNSDDNKTLDMFAGMRENSNRDLVSFNTAIASYSKLHHLNYLEKTFQELIEAECRPSLETYNCLMIGYRRLGLWWRMEEVFFLMRAVSCKPNSLTFTTLIRGYAAAKLLDRMEEVYEEMLRQGLQLRHSTAVIIVAAYTKAKEFQKIDNILSTLKAKRLTTWTLKSHASNGRISEMEALVDEAMSNRKVQFSSRLAQTVIRAYFKKEAHDKIDRFLDRAGARGWNFNVSFYNTLMFLYMNSGLFDNVKRCFESMLASKCWPNARTFEILSHAYQEGNMDEKGHDVFHTMKCAL